MKFHINQLYSLFVPLAHENPDRTIINFAEIQYHLCSNEVEFLKLFHLDHKILLFFKSCSQKFEYYVMYSGAHLCSNCKTQQKMEKIKEKKKD